MSRRIVRNADFLYSVGRAKKPERQKLIRGAGPRQLNSVAEVTKNINKGNIPVSPRIKKTFCKHKHLMRKIADRSIGTEQRKRLLLQKGGFLVPLIVSTIASLLPTLLSKRQQ